MAKKLKIILFSNYLRKIVAFSMYITYKLCYNSSHVIKNRFGINNYGTIPGVIGSNSHAFSLNKIMS